MTRQESALWSPDHCAALSLVECEEMERERPWSQESAPYLVWVLSLALLSGLSACGPTPSDPAPSVESAASLSERSVAHTRLQSSSRLHHGSTEWTSSLSPLTSPQAGASDQKRESGQRPDHKETPESLSGRSGMSDQPDWSGGASGPLGSPPMTIEEQWAAVPQVEDEGEESQLEAEEVPAWQAEDNE